MKASELIAVLQEKVRVYGDLDVETLLLEETSVSSMFTASVVCVNYHNAQHPLFIINKELPKA